MSKFKFSIVMAIYNTDKYLLDAIDSVINQSIGFEENVQLILVNDGSTDRSPEICKDYRDRYPNNIVYIEKENGGVSSARNKGLEKVEGKYVNFLDSDDKLSKNTLEEVWKFFEKHYDEIDFVSIPIYFFEGSKSQHILNFKFKGNKVIDIYESPKSIQLSIASSFLKAELFRNLRFDTSLDYAEDVKSLNDILLSKQKYGVVSTTKYLYRKRLSGSSAMQKTITKKGWYSNTLENAFLYILKKSQKKLNKVPKYFQNLVMYDLQFRLKIKDFGPLNQDEKEKYMSIIKEMLTYIDDDIIFDQNHYTQEYILFALSLKYNKRIEEIVSELKIKSEEVYFRDTLFPKFKNIRLDIREFNIKDDTLQIEGILKSALPNNKIQIFLKTSKNKKYKLKIEPFRHYDLKALERNIQKGYIFKVNIPVKSNEILEFVTSLKHKDKHVAYFFYRGLKSRYLVKKRENKIFIFNKGLISSYSYNIFRHIYLEIHYLLRLIKYKEIKTFFARILYWLFKIFKQKPLWLFIDRPMKGDENAQVLFKYANKQDDNIKKVFAISKEAPEYEELKKIGEVVNWRSIKHLIYFLLCDNLISSQADSYIVNPYGRWGKYFNDLYTFNFIFLQHGVIKDDLSSWLNKMDKDIDLFITSAKPEYNSIVENDYLYTKDEVLLSGLPRFDRLKNNPQKKILIMPTWRDYLTNKSNNLGIRGKNDNFKDTEYFKFYNNLINDKRLLETLKKLDYKMIFCLHPNAIKNADDFGSNEFVSIPTEICDYPKEFGEGSLLITDYSSVAFDFTYLRKPVLYCQFDKEKFLSKHSYEAGYFDYNRDGFGPVCKDLDSTITEIINVLDNDCKLDKKYRKRIDNFFKYNDKKNSQRVYEKIIQLES